MMLIRSGLVLLSVALTYLSFSNIFSIEGFPGLAWGALVPFLAALDERPLRERFALGCLWGVLSFALLTRWMLDVSAGGFVLFALALALAPLAFSILAAAPFRSPTFKLFWWPCAWVVSEWIRTLMMGGFTWSFAYSQAPVPILIRLASFGGVYAVAWIMVFVNSALYFALKARGKQGQFLLGAVLVFCANWAYGLSPSIMDIKEYEGMRLALVQSNITRDEKNDTARYDDNIDRQVILTKKVVSGGRPDLIIWPETAFPDDVLKDFRWRPQMEALARNLHSSLLIGSALEKDGDSFNTALLISPEGEWKDAYHKMKLVPFTEYLPADPASRLLAKTFGVRPYNFKAGKGLGILFLDSRLPESRRKVKRFGVVICSEEAYPALFRELARREVGFVVSMLNDGWFRHKEALMMHAQNAVFRAVESGVSVIRVANTGLTTAVDPKGRIIGGDYPALQTAGVANINLPLASQRTLYLLFGDIFVWLCAGFVIINLSYFLFKERFRSPCQ